MRFDGEQLAHAWLAVFAASSTNKTGNALLYKTIAIEEYPAGIRLYALDGYVMLTAWVPDLDGSMRIPPLEQLPDRTIVASDHDGRARSILGYILALVARRDDPDIPVEIDVRLDFDVRVPPGSTLDKGDTLEGLEPTFTVISVPDVEKVYLETVQGATYPDWRHLFFDHVPISTDTIQLTPELVERVAKVRKHAAGALVWSFAGEDKAARISFADSDPFVEGVVMPRKPDTDPIHVDVETTSGIALRATPGVVIVDDNNVVVTLNFSKKETELLREAAELVISTQFGSPSMLKRKLKIGSTVAWNLMEHLEAAGIVGPKVGTKARDVLYTADRMDAAIAQLGVDS